MQITRLRRGNSYENLESGSAPDASAFQSISTKGSPSSICSNNEDTFTVDQAVEAFGFGWFQIKLSFFTGLVWMADAMEMMILSILAPALHCSWNLAAWQQAMLTMVVFAGMMISSSLWGKLCDKYGRRVELMLCSSLTFYYGLLSAFAPNYMWMLILRGLVGYGIGGVPQSITLYSEFLPSKARAKCIALIELFWAVGACLVVLLSIFVMPMWGWRYLLIICAMPQLLFAIFCVWLPESARFDMARGQPAKALATLELIARNNKKPMLIGRLVEASPLTETEVKRGQIKDLFTSDLWMTTAMLWFIWLANAFSYFGVVLMTTELFEQGESCKSRLSPSVGEAIEPSCQLDCKMLTGSDYVDLLWTTLAEFPCLIVTVVFVDCLGRKKTMALQLCIFSIFVFLVSLCTSRSVLIFFLFVARTFISGAFQTAYVYTPEVYPTTNRAIGLGTCSLWARVGALITPFVAQVMLRQSLYMAIGMYGGICLVAAFFCLLLPIETRGREMKETHHVTIPLSPKP